MNSRISIISNKTMKYRNINFLNKNYKFVKGDITLEKGIVTDIAEKDNADEGILPPFVDIHIHGGYGIDVMYAEAEEIAYLSRRLYENNVGAYMPTTVAKDKDSILTTAENVKKASLISEGAEIAGIHIEGPFISKEYRGIMEEKHIVPCDIGLFDDLREIMDGLKIRFTIAPECENAEGFCKYVTENGGYISMGHSSASLEQCQRLTGASSYTHVFNAMSFLHHRESNILSSALTDELYTELICDFIHVSCECVKILTELKGDKIILVTDALRAMGQGNISFEFCGKEINVTEKGARDKNGRLAGSVLTMKRAFENLCMVSDLKTAVKAACENPAELLGLLDYGCIDIGKKVIL